ncbi:MAG TPA: META domain-containing protein [Sulfurovum sp.]|nr:META domain-containing protein [Sulfurovum sp.]
MLNRKTLMFTLFTTLFAASLLAGNTPLKHLNDLDGDWHLRVMDGKEVRKARAILDFHSKSMLLEGFDGCNRLSGKIQRTSNDRFFSKVTSTRMACRQNIHRYVSRGLKTAIKEGFTITKSKRYGVEGITLKSKHHDLFFKRMGH